MDDTDGGDVDLVPPSPIAASTQVSRSLAQNVPPLPQLFIPGSPIAGSSRSELSPLATSTQQPGTLLSPLATSTQQPGSSRSLLSPIAASTQAVSFGSLLSPVATPALQPGSSRVGVRSLSDWVVRRPTAAENQRTSTVGETIAPRNPIDEVATVDDDNGDNDDDSIVEIGEGDSEIVSVDSGESEPEEIRDSDTDSNGNVIPDPGSRGGEERLLQAGGNEDEQNSTLVGQEPTEAQDNRGIPVPPIHFELPQQGLEEQGPQEGLSSQGTPAVLNTPGPAGVQAIASVSEQDTATGTQSTPGPALHVQAITGQRESPADFRSPKRRRVISPAKPSVKEGEKASEEDDAEDGECCPICFEPWTTSGNHRLSSLRCGHLFGQSCIDKWLKGQGGKCPQCNAKAKRQDIRVLYAKSIRALDTSEKDRALKDLEKEKEARRKAEMEAAELRLKYQMAVEDRNKLRAELDGLRHKMKLVGGSVSAVGSTVNLSQRNPAEVLSSSSQLATGRFMLDKAIKIWDAGNCRVMAHCPPLATIVVSQPSSSPLFPGFGVKKISTLDFKTSQFMTVHSKAIRDISFHPSVDNGMLLSCGLDKKVKMTNLLSNAVVQSYDTPMPAWSCVWNADDRNYFYTGLQNGLILEFDIRNTDGFVQEINSGGSRSPVAALKYMPRCLQATFSAGGLLIGQLDRVQFFESLPSNHYRPHILPLDGSLTSLYVDPSTRHVLASFRPTARNPTVRHQLCELVWHNMSDTACSCNIVYTFHGGKTQTVLSKTVLIKHPADSNRLLVCAGDESDSSVHVWDSGTGQRTQTLPMGGITVDTCPLVINQQLFLAALTEKKVNLFKWC